MSIGSRTVAEAKPAVTEAALLLVLEKFFEVVLNLPTVNRYIVHLVTIRILSLNKHDEIFVNTYWNHIPKFAILVFCEYFIPKK